MRFHVVLVMVGAASVCGCIQADPAGPERVGEAEENIFVDPPTPHGFLIIADDHVRARVRPALGVPAVKAELTFATVDGDDDDDDDGGDPQ